MPARAAMLVLVFLALGCLFSALHASLTDLIRSALEDLAARRGNPRVQSHVRKILGDVTGHARAVSLTRVVCNLAVAVGMVWLVSAVRGRVDPTFTDGLIGVPLAALLLWVFSVSLPESISRHAGERFIYSLSGIVRAVYLLQLPLTPIARAMDESVRKLAGDKTASKESEIEDELRSVVEEGEREGTIDEAERRMIEAVVDFKSKTVEQIMTPRTEIEALELTNNLGAITAFVRKARHSRIPVFRESLDNIVGMFYVKDLLRWLAGESAQGGKAGGGGFDLKAILRPAMFVPRSKTVRGLAEEFVDKRVHVAVVADEYGGTAGLVTLEDIIEEVFGEIQDEYEKTEDEPPRIEVHPDQSMADIDARAYIRDVNPALEPLGISLPEEDGYDTLGGFVLAALGRIPEPNESFEHGGGRMLVTVLQATPTRVVRVRIHARPDEPARTPEQAEARESDRLD